MNTKRNDLNYLKEQNPFKLPEGYLDGLTDRIMQQLPDVVNEEPEVVTVTLFDRVRPLLYLAAVFAGLICFFKVIAPDQEAEESRFLLVKAQSDAQTLQRQIADEDEEYLEYMEEKYLQEMVSENVEEQK